MIYKSTVLPNEIALEPLCHPLTHVVGIFKLELGPSDAFAGFEPSDLMKDPLLAGS